MISWPGGVPYTFALTFDLDRIRPTYHRLWGVERGAFRNFDHIHAVLDRFDARATLFVLDQANPLPLLLRGRVPDAFGVFRLAEVSEDLRRLRARGVEIGIHGAWGTRDRADRLRRQRERLAEAVGAPIDEIRGNRQHYLDHAGAATFRAEVGAGLVYDASVGSNERNGLETYATWRPLPGLVEIPLAAMDTALLVESRATGRPPLEIARAALDGARRSGGVFQICLHPHLFRPGEVSYEIGTALLAEARADGAWLATLGEIAARAP